jgi:hypothetical protein
MIRHAAADNRKMEVRRGSIFYYLDSICQVRDGFIKTVAFFIFAINYSAVGFVYSVKENTIPLRWLIW